MYPGVRRDPCRRWNIGPALQNAVLVALLVSIPLRTASMQEPVSQSVKDAAATAFRTGLRALDLRQYEEAVTSFRQALKLRPSGGTNEKVFMYGTFFPNYSPSYFLSRALLERGDCDGAIEAFKDAEHEVVERGMRESHAKALRQRCSGGAPK